MKTMLPIKDDRIINLYNAGKNGPYCWLAMEYIEGENLAQMIERTGIEGMIDWKKVWRVAVDVGRALHTGYENKIIHRNVTPTNIIRRKSDEVCLLGDFMLAKALEGTMVQQVTQPGQILGDIPYLAPERTRADAEVDTRSDLYGLGATCYALLTGRPPVGGDSLTEMIKNVREQKPEPPKRYQLAVNDLFQDVVMKMIAKDPADRFQSPSDLIKELVRIGKYQGLDPGF
jgi:serine/threonine protein kinase